MPKNTPYSRRSLIKGGVVAAGMGVSGANPLARGTRTNHWDRMVDSVVIGSGTGLVGALVGAQSGLEVLVLEKSPAAGGTTIVSGGVVWIPNNGIQKRQGIADSAGEARRYLDHLAMGQADEELIEAFLSQGPSMLGYLEKHTNLRWRVSEHMGAVGDYHPEWKGSNIRGRSVEVRQEGRGRSGGLLINYLLTALHERGVTVHTGSPAQRLIAEEGPDGGRRITGVVANIDGAQVRIGVRRGVLMASGGFERNEQMKRHYLRGPSPYTLGCETNEGDGIRMGMELGADLRNMNEVWGMSLYEEDAKLHAAIRGGATHMHPGGTPGSVLVNRYGERFCNESASYDSRWRSFFTWDNWGELGYRNLPAFHICDEFARGNTRVFGVTADQALPPWVSVASSPRELAGKMGIDPQGLEDTLLAFNRDAQDGRDPRFHRGEGYLDRWGREDVSVTLKPLDLEGEFYGARVVAADLGTCGGLRVDRAARVLDVWGKPIVNLYASGNCAGVGGPGVGYGGGGGTLGPAMTFAYIAGLSMSHTA